MRPPPDACFVKVHAASMQEFAPILQAALTPVALISGVGLLLLSMVNRYNHAIDRIRLLLKEKPTRPTDDHHKVDQSVQVLYRRCRIMRNAILCVVTSIAFSGALVLASALEGLSGLQLFVAKELLLIAAVVLIVVAAVMFVVEVTYSLHALEIELKS